jgi:Helicase associated domain
MNFDSRFDSQRAALHSWYERLRELREYRNEHGDCLVPQVYPRQQKLASWVHNMRTRRQSLSVTRLRALAAVGFVWAQRRGQTLWDEWYAELRAYHAVHGHCNVSTKSKVSVKALCPQELIGDVAYIGPQTQC